MNFTQKLLLWASSMGLFSGIAPGQTNSFAFTFQANSVANFRQTRTAVNFEGATFGVSVRDGAFVWAGQPCEDRQFFSGTGKCAPGSTGFVSRGLENDPVLRGLGPYFTITSISPALILRPFDAQKALLIAAPPSLLPRPQLGFEDSSISIFYDLYTNFIRQYPISRYDFRRSYAAGERTRFDGEVVPGTYRYNFGSLENPLVPVVLEVNQYPMLDGYRKVNNQPRGVRFLNVTHDDDFAVLDPYDLNTLTWEGNTISFIAPGADVSYISIKRLEDPTDPLSDPLYYDGQGSFDANGNPNPTIPLFPPIAGTSAVIPRVLLPSPLNTTFIIPPGFLQPGQTGVVDLEFEIYRPTSNLIFERASRNFRMPVKVTDPAAGFITASLPPGATAQQRAADFDFDGDGVSNFNEWVFRSNPGDAGSVPSAPSVSFVPSSSDGTQLKTALNETAASSVLEYKVAKLTNPVPKLSYCIEYSPDMVTWTEIKPGNPDWTLLETYDEIKVTDSGASPKTGGFFRTKVQPAN